MSNSRHYPIEAMLRPAVEYWSALTCGGVGAAVLIMPNVLWIPPRVGVLMGIGLLPLAIRRYCQGRAVRRYKDHLFAIPSYALSSVQLPVQSNKLFLGRGFKWEAIHTERLLECADQRISTLMNAAQTNKNPSDIKNSVGGNSFLHGVEPNEIDVFMNLSDRVGHTLVLGTTRVGKTRLLEVLAAQDIQRGDCVIVFDPKGDAELLRRIIFEAKRAGREDDVIVFHLGFPEVSARYNPVGNFARVTEVANRVANQLPGNGESAAFKEFGWRFVNIIAQALVILGLKSDYRQVQRYILNMEPLLLDYCTLWLSQVNPNWETEVKAIEEEIKVHNLALHLRSRSKRALAIVEYIKLKKLYDPVAEGLCSAFNYDKTYFDKITASLLPLIEKLTTGQSAALISPDYFDLENERPIFDWMQVIRGKKIVYIGLDALSDSTVATAVGSSMFSDLCSVAGQLYKFGVEGNADGSSKKILHPICVHADEFNELIGDDFIPLINKSGGAGVQVTAYTQTWSDVEAKLVSKAKAGQVGGNFNTLIALRVLDEETSKMITHKLPERVNIQKLVQGSSVSDNPELLSEVEFNTSNEDRVTVVEVPLLTPSDLLQLPKGQAFVLMNGGTLYKICIPLPKDDMSGIPANIEAMTKLVNGGGAL